MYGATSIQHQKDPLNNTETITYTSLAESKRLEKQHRPVTFENGLSANQNADLPQPAPNERFRPGVNKSSGPPTYSASKSIPNLEGVDIPIDLDALLDSLVIPWDPPENDIDDIMKSMSYPNLLFGKYRWTMCLEMGYRDNDFLRFSKNFYFGPKRYLATSFIHLLYYA